ncbi:MAG: Cna B-type domain-containing protein [Eubacteriales bacterium]|nr:Cna B-type domain-containing protein [Eubacteriales bacterium]
MKKKGKKTAAAFLFSLLWLTMLPASAMAAQSAAVELPVSIRIEGEAPAPAEAYTIALTPQEGAPMPAQSELQMTGEGTGKFPAISYAVPGIYQYTVSQQAGSHERGLYDAAVFYVRVTVTNAEKGGLEAAVAVYKDAQMQGEKQNIEFVNRYAAEQGGETNPTPPSEPQEAAPPAVNTLKIAVGKVWIDADNQAGTRPESISVQLYRDGQAYGVPVALSEENRWWHQWTGLDRTKSWTVDEVGVPEGYEKSMIKNSDTAFVIVNTYKPFVEAVAAQPPAAPGTDHGAKTGDASQMVFWLAVLAAAATGLTVTGVMAFRKRRENGE